VSKLLRNVGPQRLMWGSDWPFSAFEDRMSYKKAIADYKRYVPDVSIRRSIDRTARAFYFA
jgi:predicted TIM-barrel fold metal-dependent hydrolase